MSAAVGAIITVLATLMVIMAIVALLCAVFRPARPQPLVLYPYPAVEPPPKTWRRILADDLLLLMQDYEAWDISCRHKKTKVRVDRNYPKQTVRVELDHSSVEI